jgi:hypothetical protein
MNFKTFYYLNSYKIFLYFFLLAFACQIFFWKKTEKIHTSFDLVPPAPNAYLTSVLSLGDNEFLFRILAARLQNSGDVFAGFVALKNYDYSRVYDWMKALDRLNSRSSLVPGLASYYYAQTQKVEDNYYIVKYLDEHAMLDLDANWWWLMQAVFIAKKELKDINLAIELADKLAKNEAKNAPFWTKYLNAVLRESKGDNCMIFEVMQNLVGDLNNNKENSLEKLDMERYFIKHHLEKLRLENFNPAKCRQKKS